MISNPASFFINGSKERKFTYEGGSTLFHWSPYESGLSSSMESNVIFFANNEDHARDVLRRLFEFWIDCNEQYVKTEGRNNDYHGLTAQRKTEIDVLRNYLTNISRMKISIAPVNQFYKVSWAANDGLNVYEK